MTDRSTQHTGEANAQAPKCTNIANTSFAPLYVVDDAVELKNGLIVHTVTQCILAHSIYTTETQCKSLTCVSIR